MGDQHTARMTESPLTAPALVNASLATAPAHTVQREWQLLETPPHATVKLQLDAAHITAHHHARALTRLLPLEHQMTAPVPVQHDEFNLLEAEAETVADAVIEAVDAPNLALAHDLGLRHPKTVV